MYKIYKLVDNFDIVRYVGVTKRKLSIRFSEHVSKNTFDGVKDCKIELLEETDDKTRERFWIDYFGESTLFNGNKGLGYVDDYYEKNKETIRLKRQEKSEERKVYYKAYRESKKNDLEFIEKQKIRNAEYRKKDNVKNYHKDYIRKWRESKKNLKPENDIIGSN